MRLLTSVFGFSLGFSLVLLLTVSVYPHGGGLDAYGCHHNRKQGGYHCHRGPLAGQSFGSQDEMLQKLKEKLPSKDTKSKKE